MVQISFSDNEAIVKFPKNLMSSDYVQEFLQRLRLEAIAEKSQLTEESAWKMSEELKEKWWRENRTSFLKGTKGEESNR